jgi:hypothetical protein
MGDCFATVRRKTEFATEVRDATLRCIKQCASRTASMNRLTVTCPVPDPVVAVTRIKDL